MQEALYHPHFGYYNSENFTIGAAGDFITAPEISPLFAKCLAKPITEVLNILPHGAILELGAGTGRLSGLILSDLANKNSLPHYFIYEISQSLQKKQQQFIKDYYPQHLRQITWVTELPKNFTGIILANEVFDALPINCFEVQNEKLFERVISYDAQGFIWQLKKPDALLERKLKILNQTFHFSEGYQSEINLSFQDFLEKINHSLTRGVFLIADYGYNATEFYRTERNKGTLNCFYQHHQHRNPLQWPGLQDITSHVNFSHIADISHQLQLNLQGYTTQASFLLECGLMSFASASYESLSIDEQLALSKNIKLLTFPTEMGEQIKVMALSKNLNNDITGFKALNLSYSL